jgi:hypothetical protein
MNGMKIFARILIATTVVIGIYDLGYQNARRKYRVAPDWSAVTLGPLLEHIPVGSQPDWDALQRQCAVRCGGSQFIERWV